MTNSFSLLQEEEDDTSTNNSRRKLEKMIRMQENNPTVDRAKRIKELDAIVNPPKTIPKKNKKKKRVCDESEGDILDKAYKENHHYWKGEEERKKKEREERIAKEAKEKLERDERIKQEKIEQEKRKKIEENIQKQRIANELKKLLELPDDIRSFIADDPDKRTYKKLVLKYHPDKGGDIEYFKIINNHMN